MKRILPIIVALLGFAFISCTSPLAGSDDAPDSVYGSMTVSLESGSGSRTLLPTGFDPVITSYEFTLTGPNAEAITKTFTGGNLTFDTLVPGTWTINLVCKNAGAEIVGSGSATVIVEAAKTVSATIAIAPVAGKGTLSLSLSWPAASLVSPTASATLTPESGGETVDLTFAVSGETATYDGLVSSGSYILLVRLNDGGSVVWGGTMEAASIIKDKKTTGTFTISENQLKQAPGTPYSFSFDPDRYEGGVKLAWRAQSDNETFTLERSIDSAAFTKLVDLPFTTCSYIDESATAYGFVYSYRLKAVNRWGESGYTTTFTTRLRKYYNAYSYMNLDEGKGTKYQISKIEANTSVAYSYEAWAVGQKLDLTKTRNNMVGYVSLAADNLSSWCKSSFQFIESSVAMYDTYVVMVQNIGGSYGNEGNFYRFASMPKDVRDGQTWYLTIQSEKVYFTATKLDEYNLDGTIYTDCIRVDIDNSLATSDYRRGTGFIVYAKDKGPVHIEFSRNSASYAGTKVVYKATDFTVFQPYVLSGKILAAGVPEPDVRFDLILSTDLMSGNSIAADGSYAVTLYGPEIPLHFFNSDMTAQKTILTTPNPTSANMAMDIELQPTTPTSLTVTRLSADSARIGFKTEEEIGTVRVERDVFNGISWSGWNYAATVNINTISSWSWTDTGLAAACVRYRLQFENAWGQSAYSAEVMRTLRLQFNPGVLALLIGETATPSYALVPGETFTWSSDTTGVATVDSSTGLVTPVALGKATITGTCVQNSAVTMTIPVFVVADNAVIGSTTVLLDATSFTMRTSKTLLGTLVCQGIRHATGAAVAMENGGGIRATLEIGNIFRKQAYYIHPFANVIQMTTLKGSEFDAIIENGVSSLPAANGRYPQFSGLTFTLDAGQPVGSRVSNILINGVAVVDTTDYTFASTNFVFAGGDGYTMFPGTKSFTSHGTDAEALIAYIDYLDIVDEADINMTN